MSDVKELNEEDLKQVTGGTKGEADDECPCKQYDPAPHYGTGAGSGGYLCTDCVHYMRPEGPCELGLPLLCKGQKPGS